MRWNSIIRSARVANIIALLALGISIWSALYAHRLGKFSETAYIEEKRAVIRLLAYDLRITEDDFLQDVENFLSNSDYKFQTEDAIRLGQIRDETKSVIKDTKELQSGIDKTDLDGDPRFVNYYASKLEEFRRHFERNKKLLVDLKSRISQRQKP